MATVRILCLLGLVVAGMSITFILEPEELRCFKKYIEGGDFIGGDVTVSGINEKMVKVKVTDEKGVVHYLEKEQKNFYFRVEAAHNTTVQVCIEALDANQKIISMNLQSFYEGLRLSIEEDSKDPMIKDLHEIDSKLITIIRNQETFQIRQTTHKNLINQSERHIRWSMLFKVAALFVIAAFQIGLIMNLLRNFQSGPQV
eukprot:TRINITY_DN9525_c0_g1_i2.p1 TRINITY_DN9525_c0_g1~~TRINITY_DN9525_c0_g1_i2.p1  ORF type:complete len:200 (-),score=32.08 TRINITY_DN9525_c0_g1_i2:77-676(-)